MGTRILLHLLYFLLLRVSPGRGIDCNDYCEDPSECKRLGCVYDYLQLHCFPSCEDVKKANITYTDYDINSFTACVNVGGRAHVDSDGYIYVADKGFRLGETVKDWGKRTIQGADPADAPLYTTTRSGATVKYDLRFTGGNGNFLLRIHFCEIEFNRRGQRVRAQGIMTSHIRESINIVLNRGMTLARSLDVFREAGGQYKALVLDYPVVISGGMIRVRGQTSVLSAQTSLEFKSASFSFRNAKAEAFCATRYHRCTDHCDDPEACFKTPGCFFDYSINHCTQLVNKAAACAKHAGNKAACLNQNCYYCCKDQTCTDELVADDCNFECAAHCEDPKECELNACSYNNQTGQCEEQTGPDCSTFIGDDEDDFENCLSCTGSGDQCAFMTGTDPKMCVSIKTISRTSGKDYYTMPDQCQKDCGLHLQGNNEFSKCLACTRNNDECAYSFPWCQKPMEEGKCVPRSSLAPPANSSMNPDYSWNSTECKRNCELHDGNPMDCKRAGCNYCCSNDKCYYDREHEGKCATGCQRFCGDEMGCLEAGCFFSQGRCMDKRTGCSKLHHDMKACMDLGCNYCCNLGKCFPSDDTEIDNTPKNPRHKQTETGCCEEGNTDRFFTPCTLLSPEGKDVTGLAACSKTTEGHYTGTIMHSEECRAKHLKFQCSRKEEFWSLCVTSWRELKVDGEDVCENLNAVFINAYSVSTCPEGKMRFLCYKGDRRLTARTMLSLLARNQVSGRAGDDMKQLEIPTSDVCRKSCEDAAGCKSSGCYYDYRQLHCFDNEEEAKMVEIEYNNGYTTASRAVCMNNGGTEHTDIYGYLHKDDSSPTKNYMQNVTDFGPSVIIDGVDPRDRYLFQTERQGSVMMYVIHFSAGDGHYQFKLQFIELTHQVEGKRKINVQLGRKLYLVKELDIFKEVGFGKAYVLDFAIIIKNDILTYKGETLPVKNMRVQMEIKAVIRSWTYAKTSAFCIFTHYVCTDFCDDKETCDNTPGCYFDKTINHCTDIINKPKTCGRLNGTKADCLENGCFYCCLQDTCHVEEQSAQDCGEGCQMYCQEQDRCEAAAEFECEFNEETRGCEEPKVICSRLINDSFSEYDNCLRCTAEDCRYDPATGGCDKNKGEAPPGAYVNTTQCKQDCSLSKDQPMECRGRDCWYCCSSKSCHMPESPDFDCDEGCSQYCGDPGNCTANGCFPDCETGECRDVPPGNPCEMHEDGGCPEIITVPTILTNSECNSCCDQYSNDEVGCTEHGCQFCSCPTPRCISEEEECYKDVSLCTSLCGNREECTALAEPKCSYNSTTGECYEDDCGADEIKPCLQDIVFIMDCSWSITEVKGLKAFVRRFTADFMRVWKEDPNNRVALYLFGPPEEWIPMTSTLTPKELDDRVQDAPTKPNSDIPSTAVAAMEHLLENRIPGRKQNIIFLSDGECEDFVANVTRTADAVHAAEIRVFSLHLTMTEYSAQYRYVLLEYAEGHEERISPLYSVDEKAKDHVKYLSDLICER